MSAVSDAKARLGYRQSGRTCDQCLHCKRNGDWTNGRIRNACTLGNFAVKARATCDSWADHTKPMLAKMEGEK
jgi:hypothetical protein